MKKVEIFTDSICLDNPGKCGWAAIMVYGSHKKELGGAVKQCSKKRIELFSALSPLKMLLEPCNVTLYSDSSYLTDAFNKKFIFGWARKGFKDNEGEDIENRDMWEILLQLSQAHDIEFIKLKGHSAHPLCEECELIARSYVLTKRELAEFDRHLSKNSGKRGRF